MSDTWQNNLQPDVSLGINARHLFDDTTLTLADKSTRKSKHCRQAHHDPSGDRSDGIFFSFKLLAKLTKCTKMQMYLCESMHKWSEYTLHNMSNLWTIYEQAEVLHKAAFEKQPPRIWQTHPCVLCCHHNHDSQQTSAASSFNSWG